MLTQTAKNDLAALRAMGFNPTDEEVVQLNDIALRIERGKETTPANMPRVAFAGNVILHEPTIGAVEWWYNFGSIAAYSDKARVMTYFFMSANAKNLDYLDTLQTPKQINKAVKEWKKTVNATESELWRALWYVKYGYEDAGDIKTEPDENVLDELWSTVCMAAGMLGVPPQQLRTQTQSTIISCLINANLKVGMTLKRSIAEDYIKYRMLVKKIEERGKQKDNG